MMKGCSHILTESDANHLKYGRPGMCVDLIVRPTRKSDISQARVLEYPQVNTMLFPLYLKADTLKKKVFFEITENFSLYGLSYEYDSTISEIAAYISDYRSEIFDGGQWLSAALEKMALSVLKQAGGIEGAKRWILLDELPAGCGSISQFLLSIVYPS